MQVKKVPGVGKPEDSCTIDGAVCRKNLAHKRMCRHFKDPKILMVAKNLEFNRAQSRLTSLEGMTKQEARLLARQLMSSTSSAILEQENPGCDVLQCMPADHVACVTFMQHQERPRMLTQLEDDSSRKEG